MTKEALSKKYRIVPRAAGDTAPLDPKIAEAIGKAGMDPARFTLAPFEAGEADVPVAALFTSGSRLEHTFAFGTLNGALSAVERIVDDDRAARISKQGAKWLVVFDGRVDPNVAASDMHQSIASRVIELGAADGGFSHLTDACHAKSRLRAVNHADLGVRRDDGCRANLRGRRVDEEPESIQARSTRWQVPS